MSKKATPHPSVAASPTAQKTSEAAAQQEKMNSELKSLLQAMHQDLKEVKEEVKKANEKIGKVEDEVKEMKEMMGKTEERIQKVEERSDQIEKKVEEINLNTTISGKNHERAIITMEMDRADYYLRFQNIEEEKGENLPELIAEMLAEPMMESKEKIMNEVDEIFRVHTRYAMRYNLPREIHVRFTKKAVRNQILQMARNTTIKHKMKEIVILKQIPRRVRDIRKAYQFLTKCLIRKGMNFRWLIPEGLLVNWQDQRHRLDTLDKAESFYYQYIEFLEDTKPTEEGKEKSQETKEKERERQIIELKEREERAIREGTRSKESKEQRVTRATSQLNK